jgi:predicted KAP-like P-loop ATPase
LIAQELKSALDDLEIRFDALGYTEEHDAYRLSYEELIAPIIKAIQEQQDQIEELKQEVETLKNK